MTTLKKLLLAVALLSAAVLGACSRDDNTGFQGSPEEMPGVDFLLFPNGQAALGVGDYAVLFVNAVPPIDPTPYTLTVRQTDGTVQTFSGNLSMTGAIITHPFEVSRAGGATVSLDSNGVVALMVVRVGGATSNLAISSTTANPTIDLPRYHIDSVTYAEEYYKAIDPQNTRATLAGFKTTNGFGSICNPNGTTEFNARFRDVLDLGYGRHMCARGSTTAAGNIAFWVENFQVTAVPGVKYGPLNLEAVVTDDRRWHIGTNAIEYSPGPNGGARILKFYTFNPDGTRRLLVDLDGRGAKAMPIPCISCHGGRAPPLLANATTVTGGGGVTSRFPDMPDVPRGGTLARMQPINVDTLDFALVNPYRRADQEATLKAMNRLVLCTFPNTGDAGTEDNCRTAAANSEWQGTNAAMIKAWYGGTNLPNNTQSDSLFLPPGWAAGAEENIYRTVVAPNCRVCHSLRGNGNQSDIDFMTYAKFSGYADQIKHHVFDKGNMPLALLKFDHFWESNAPATLASIIPGSTTGGGSVLSPTRPVAVAGPDRAVRPGTTKLSAAESSNATAYSWSTSAPCSFAAGENTKIRPTLTTAIGSCTVQLIVSNGAASSTADTLTVVVSNSAPIGTRFVDIRTNILQAPFPGPSCNSCHCVGCDSQIPLYYDTGVDYDGDGDMVDDAADLHQLYLNVRARINFADIENSPLLRKPTGNHHCGFDPLNITGLPPGDPNPDRVLYDTLLNWILNGAPE